jgi:predicted nucleic acid-binding protein
VTITADLLSMACAVAQRRRLRGYDAVHLATALSISRAGRRHTGLGLTMLSSDGALNDAARAEGLDVIDPSAEA